MRISTGVSEIVFSPVPHAKSVYEKVYLWPAYNEGRIDKVPKASRRLEPGDIYSIPFDKNYLLTGNVQKSPDIEYTSKGTIDIRRTTSSLRGVFFDALV